MPSAAGVCCKLPGQTPGQPFYTIHKCRICRGYFHGICGEKDPIEDDDGKRVYEGRKPTATKSRNIMAFVVFSIRIVWSGSVYIVLLKTWLLRQKN